jgi:hypothetical protein
MFLGLGAQLLTAAELAGAVGVVAFFSSRGIIGGVLFPEPPS